MSGDEDEDGCGQQVVRGPKVSVGFVGESGSVSYHLSLAF